MNDDARYGKEEIGASRDHSNPKAKPGYSLWIESGVFYTAPIIDRRKFGKHAYDGEGYTRGIRDCPCGCWMLSSSSGGPVDPFGHCPVNPKSAEESK